MILKVVNFDLKFVFFEFVGNILIIINITNHDHDNSHFHHHYHDRYLVPKSVMKMLEFMKYDNFVVHS